MDSFLVDKQSQRLTVLVRIPMALMHKDYSRPSGRLLV